MGRTLLVIRHGAAAAGIGLSDAERPLTPEGVSEVRMTASGLARQGLRAGIVLSSPLVRAMETASLIASELVPDRAAVCCDELLPTARPAEVLEAVKDLAGDAAVVVVVGHMPNVLELTRFLAAAQGGGAVDPVLGRGFATAAVAKVDFCGDWERGRGTLRWLRTPAELGK